MNKYNTKRPGKAKTVFKVILTVITIALLLVIILSVYVQKKQLEELKKRCTDSVTGVCVDVTSVNKTRTKHKKLRNGSKSYKTQDYYKEYTSHIRYTVNGTDYNAVRVNEDRPYPEEGGSISVFYDPSDPTVYYIP